MSFLRRPFSSGGIWKPKNPHSLEYLKYLHGVLTKNAVVTEHNRGLLVEALRAIAEILIWGDQNDATVFDYFLEKNMLSYFLKIMNQKCGRYICVQLLQTLNILFENIRHTTSLYYLLSNNHVNSIITHRFDFSDEEIMAYYISFLKTLSLKLNSNTVHFFFNEQTKDFPLYTEAIKFFNHQESMVRIAVRTLTLNVLRVSDLAMLKFIRDEAAAPYFSNLVWFIGNHVAEMENYVGTSVESRVLDRMSALIAEHLDHIHYLNDILSLNLDLLSRVLTDQLIQRLFLPLYLGSLAPHLQPPEGCVSVSKVMAFFLLTQIFLIITYQPLVEQLLTLLLFGDSKDLRSSLSEAQKTLRQHDSSASLEQAVEGKEDADDDKDSRPLFSSLLAALNCSGSDHAAFFALTLLYAIGRNEGIPSRLLEAAELRSSPVYDKRVVEKVVRIIRISCEKECQIRLVTVEMCCLVLRQLVVSDESGSFLQDQFYAQLVGAKEAIVNQLVQFYRTEDLFLDLFEDEYQQFQRQDLKVFLVSTEPALLLPPCNTPLSGVEFSRRLPCGPQEQARRAVRVYFLIRQLLLDLDGANEMRLPLSNPAECVAINDCLNLNNSDILSCTISYKNGTKVQRFLVTDGLQLILVEPDAKRLGWGLVRFVGFLQDVELNGDKEDSRALQISVHQASSRTRGNSQPLLNARFVFDDHIRCMAAKQRLSKGRQKARQFKMDLIADLLEIPPKLRGPSSFRAPLSTNASPRTPRSSNPWSGRAPGSASLESSSQSSAVESDSPDGANCNGPNPLVAAEPLTGRELSDADAIPLQDLSPTGSASSEPEQTVKPSIQCFVPPSKQGKTPKIQDI